MTSETAPSLARDDAEALLHSPFHELLGFELLEWNHGSLVMRFVPPPVVREARSGFVHGGALSTALDTAACFAAISAVGTVCSTVELQVAYLRPVTDDELLVNAATLRVGKRFAWTDATIMHEDGRALTTARGLFTWAANTTPEGVAVG